MIQIFGRSKCKTTRAAQRFFSDRRIQVQQIDLDQRGMSRGELDSVARAVGLRNLYDASRDRTTRYAAPTDAQLVAMLVDDPSLLKTPIVRDGPRAAVGPAEDVWRAFAEAAKG